MPIELIDKIKQKNNGTFPLVEAQDIEVSNGKRLPEVLNEKLSINELNTAINIALAQAKESGEFDGEQGPQGPGGADGADGRTPEKGVDYFTEEDKQEFIDNATPVIEGKIEEILGEVNLDGKASSVVYDSDMAETHDVANVRDVLDKLLNKVYYSAVNISSFTGGGIYEVGTVISSVSFAWKLNKNPLSIAIKQGSSLIKDKLPVDSRSYTYPEDSENPITINSDTTFTLTCGDKTDGGADTSRTASTSLVFLYKLFYNTITGNTPSTQNEIQAMGVSGDETEIHWSNSKTITHAFKGKKFCIALPSSMSISKVVTSNKEEITSEFVAGSEIDYTVGSTTTKYKVYTLEVPVAPDITLTITLE